MTGGTQVATIRPAWQRYGIRLIGLALFAVVLLTVDLRQVWAAVSQISLLSLVEALALCIILLLLKCFRWFLLLKWMGIPQRPGESMGVYSDSVFWGLITPGRLGELKRTLYLKRKYGVPFVRGGALWLIDQGFDLLAIVLILVLTLITEPGMFGGVISPVAVYMFAAGILLALVSRVLLLRTMRTVVGSRGRIGYLVDEATRDLIALSHRQFAALFGISVAALAAYFGMIVLMSRYLPFTLTLSEQAGAVAAVMMSALLPISYFNFGSRELVLAAFFSAYGLSLSDAVSYSCIFVICYLLAILVSFGLARISLPSQGGRTD